jgi:hypothetical protein
MKHMSFVKVLCIFSGDNVYLIVPMVIQSFQTIELFPLMGSQIGEVLIYQLHISFSL